VAPAQIAGAGISTSPINAALFVPTCSRHQCSGIPQSHAISTKSSLIDVKHTSHRTPAATSFLRDGDRYLRAGRKADSDPTLKARLDPGNARGSCRVDPGAHLSRGNRAGGSWSQGIGAHRGRFGITLKRANRSLEPSRDGPYSAPRPLQYQCWSHGWATPRMQKPERFCEVSAHKRNYQNKRLSWCREGGRVSSLCRQAPMTQIMEPEVMNLRYVEQVFKTSLRPRSGRCGGACI